MKQANRPYRQNSTNGGRRYSSNGRNSNTHSGNSSSLSSTRITPSTSESEKALNDKLVYLLAKSVGKTCIATVSLGARYHGLLLCGDLSSAEPPLSSGGPSPLSVIIQNPRLFSKPLVDDKNNLAFEPLPQKLIIGYKDLMDLEVTDVDVSLGGLLGQNSIEIDEASSKPVAARTKSISGTKSKPSESTTATTDTTTKTTNSVTNSKFKTDVDISGKPKTQIRERELQKWVPDANDGDFLTLEDDSGAGWDQFKVNQEKFGVELTYDEHLYTTRINKAAPDYEQRVKEADKLAREIEGLGSSNPHVLEERGIQIDDSGVDEEDKYSGVDRRGDELMAALRSTSILEQLGIVALDKQQQGATLSSTPGAYVPPRQRAAQYHNDPAIISSSATTNSHKTTENPIKLVAENETFRLNAQNEINSLREFSANFKVPHKVPLDMLPMIKKDIRSKIDQEKVKPEQKPLTLKEEASKDEVVKQLTVSNRKKMDPSKPSFKPNVNATAFTPAAASKVPPLAPPVQPSGGFNRSPNNPSPRMHSLRTHTGGSSSSSGSKRHHVTAQDFFGGASKVPTKESQQAKSKKFQESFNLFFTLRAQHGDSPEPLVLEKTFVTPPTWEFTVDKPHDQLFPVMGGGDGGDGNGNGNGLVMSPFGVPSAPVGLGSSPYVGGGPVGGPVGAPRSQGSGKHPNMAPELHQHQQPQQNQHHHHHQHQQHQQHQQAAMAAFHQQQQFQAAMMYQQQFGGMAPAQAVPMYGPGEPFLPPGGYLAGGPPMGFASPNGSGSPGMNSPTAGHSGMNYYNVIQGGNFKHGYGNTYQNGGRKHSGVGKRSKGSNGTE